MLCELKPCIELAIDLILIQYLYYSFCILCFVNEYSLVFRAVTNVSYIILPVSTQHLLFGKGLFRTDATLMDLTDQSATGTLKLAFDVADVLVMLRGDVPLPSAQPLSLLYNSEEDPVECLKNPGFPLESLTSS